MFMFILDIWSKITDFAPLENKFGADKAEFDHLWGQNIIKSHWTTVWIIVILYLLIVKFGPEFMKSKKDRIVPRQVLFSWNLSLAIFSILGCMSSIPHFLYHSHGGLLMQGYRASVCTHGSWFYFGESGTWMFYFTVSKLFELVDTLWLILNKKPVILLHWYHHATVLLFCWHAYCKGANGIWFLVMNYFVHAVMYTYYALMTKGPAVRKYLKKIAPIVTILQIGQMIMGTVVVFSGFYYKMFSREECAVDISNNVFGVFMYASYLVLFVQFFVKRFCSSRSNLGFKIS